MNKLTFNGGKTFDDFYTIRTTERLNYGNKKEQLYASSEHGKCPCTTFTSAPTIWYNKTSSPRAIDDDHLASEP